MEARIAELVALGIVALCAVQGGYQGLVMKVYSLVRLVLLLVVTIVLVPLILPLIPVSVTGREGIALVVALIVVAVALGVLADLLKIIDHIPVVSTVNKLGGALLGVVLGMLIVWVVLLLIGAFQDVEWCRQVSGYIRQSPILMEIQRFNPLPNIMKNFNFPIL